MKASEAKTGQKYLTQKGVVATKTGEKDGKILMTLASGIVFRCGPDYELKPVDGKTHKPSSAPKKAESAPKEKHVADAPRVSMGSIIDPYLLGGGHTVAEIAVELGRKAGDAAKGKDLEANVRARMVSYTRKGWEVVKDEQKRVKVVQSK